MLKKVVLSIVMSFMVLLCFSIPTFAAYDSKQMPLRPTATGDWGQARIDLGAGQTSFYVTVKQSGIHAGQKAHTYWTIEHFNTNTREHVRDVPGDFYGTLVFSNLKHPGGMYDIVWMSKTSNDTQGYYQLHSKTGDAVFYHIR